ncbi:hypothetical protein [Leptospira dzoumogneensis]|nr:hypothetical protein [Leptospira dzoumogneensis]
MAYFYLDLDKIHCVSRIYAGLFTGYVQLLTSESTLCRKHR